MKITTSVVLFAAAAASAIIGGILERANGPGTQPGLALAHLAGILMGCAAAACVVALTARWLDRKAIITASDGNLTFPLVGPYDCPGTARRALPRIREQLDPHDHYLWNVVTTTDPSVIGIANDHVNETQHTSAHHQPCP